MIEINKLNKYYSSTWVKDLVIYKDLDLSIKTWEFISILWTSWSWKTTLLNLISWLDTFNSWEILVWDNSVWNLSHEEKTKYRWKNISFIFQQFNLVDNLTVKENIDLVIELNSLERRYTTEEILKIVWLESKIDTYPFNLSWWEQQRVAVARAFVWKTPILFADEPTWNLDDANTKIIVDLIIKLHKETKNTIIMITHDKKIWSISDKTYYISGNKLVLEK